VQPRKDLPHLEGMRRGHAESSVGGAVAIGVFRCSGIQVFRIGRSLSVLNT
jgi:hypothetical protein